MIEDQLTGNYRKLPEFETVEAQELHGFLTKNETKLTESLADLVVKKYGIHDLKELRTKTNDRSLLNESGFGETKLNQLQTFFNILEKQETALQSNLDFVANLEEGSSDSEDPVFRKAAKTVFDEGPKHKIHVTRNKKTKNKEKAQAIVNCIENIKFVANMVSTIMQNVLKNKKGHIVLKI